MQFIADNAHSDTLEMCPNIRLLYQSKWLYEMWHGLTNKRISQQVYIVGAKTMNTIHDTLIHFLIDNQKKNEHIKFEV